MVVDGKGIFIISELLSDTTLIAWEHEITQVIRRVKVNLGAK